MRVMEYKGLWEDKKSPMKVFVVTESDNDFVENVICDSYFSAHFEFKKRVEAVKKRFGDHIYDDEYVLTEEADYFNVYKDGYASECEVTIYIKENEVVSYS